MKKKSQKKKSSRFTIYNEKNRKDTTQNSQTRFVIRFASTGSTNLIFETLKWQLQPSDSRDQPASKYLQQHHIIMGFSQQNFSPPKNLEVVWTKTQLWEMYQQKQISSMWFLQNKQLLMSFWPKGYQNRSVPRHHAPPKQSGAAKRRNEHYCLREAHETKWKLTQ